MLSHYDVHSKNSSRMRTLLMSTSAHGHAATTTTNLFFEVVSYNWRDHAYKHQIKRKDTRLLRAAIHNKGGDDGALCPTCTCSFFVGKWSVTMGGTMQPVVHSIKRSSGRVGQPVVTPTPRHPLCRGTIAGPCRQLREKQPRRASRAILVGKWSVTMGGTMQAAGPCNRLFTP
jgi:hypothetical protein